MIEYSEKRKKFLESIKAPTEEMVGGPVDYSNVVLNAKLQQTIYRRENSNEPDIYIKEEK